MSELSCTFSDVARRLRPPARDLSSLSLSSAPSRARVFPLAATLPPDLPPPTQRRFAAANALDDFSKLFSKVWHLSFPPALSFLAALLEDKIREIRLSNSCARTREKRVVSAFLPLGRAV